MDLNQQFISSYITKFLQEKDEKWLPIEDRDEVPPALRLYA